MQKTIYTLHGRVEQKKNWRRLAKTAETMGLNLAIVLHRFAAVVENEDQLRQILYGDSQAITQEVKAEQVK